MAFSLDHLVSYVKIDEPDLISIHRSTSTIVPNDDNGLGHLCDAFICTARENNACRVYVALYDTRQKSNLVFLTDPVAPKECGALTHQAERFLNELGFSMEPVNVNFSPATREVILRDMKVTRPPRVGAVKCHSGPDAVAEPIVAVSQPHQPNIGDAGKELVLIARLAESKVALESLAAQKEELARKASREFKKIKSERDRLKKELEAAVTARLDAETSLTLIKDGTPGVIGTLEGERDSLRAELAALREETDRLAGEFSAAREGLGRENNSLQQEIDRLNRDREIKERALTREMEALQAALATSGEGEAKAIAALQTERDAVYAELGAVKEEKETLKRRLATAQDEFDAEKRLLRQEMDRLEGELELVAVQPSNEVEALRGALAVVDEALNTERARNESALREMDALERNAAAELMTLNRKVDSLTTEKRLLESKGAEMKLKAKGEIERLQQLNQSQRRAAMKKVNALKEEIHQLAEARAAITSSLGPAPMQGSTPEPPLALSGKKTPAQSRDIRESAAVSAGPFAHHDRNDTTSFEPDVSLKGVPCTVPEDVVEVHRSFNRITTAHHGKQVQKCDAVVCLVREGTQEAVYAAWLMNDTGEVLVCRPENGLDGGNDARRMLSEGIGYFERIGFFMDRLQLEDDPELRQRQLDELPIFHWGAMVRAA